MKKIIAFLMLLLFSTTSVIAEELTINLATATDEELSSIVQLIQEEQLNRYKASLTAQQLTADADGISFRGIPWFSTLEYTESQLGTIPTYQNRGEVYRKGYIYSYGGHNKSDVIEGDTGCRHHYSLKVAGYQPTSSRACYIFPIVDGRIIRDPSLAQLYMGYYTFDGDSFGDLSKVYDDLSGKLNALYGEGVGAQYAYYLETTWRDEAGNYTVLYFHTGASYMVLAYIAAEAEQRLDEMAAAYLNEKTLEDDILRNKNLNNTDGL